MPRPPHPASRQGAGEWAGRLGGEGAKREKSLPDRRGAFPSPSTLSGSLKSRFDPLSISLPVGQQRGVGLAARTAPPHPPTATPAPYLAPFPHRTGGFRKVRGKPAAPAPSPITTPSPPILWLGVQAGTKLARETQTAGKLFAETPASSGGQPLPSLRHPLPALRAIRHCTSTVHSCVMMGGGGGAQKGSCFQKSHSGLGEELEKRGSKACLRQGFGF